MARWRKAWHVLKGLPRSRAYFRDPPDSLLPDRQGYLKAMRGLEQTLRDEGLTAPLYRIPHHLAHAASAALALPDGTGGILTADGMGEWTTAATWRADSHRLERLRHAVYPHSPGKAYAAITQWLGFVPESDEGKTMGLAAYGSSDSEAARFASGLLTFDVRRILRVRERAFGFPWGEARLFGNEFVETLGPARRPEQALRDGDADVARGMQDAIEDTFVRVANQLLDASDRDALVAAIEPNVT